MSDLLDPAPIGPADVQPRVRLRCTRCEVAWTGAPRSACWVCGERGMVLSVATLAVRAGSVDLEVDFDLLT